MNKKVSKNWPEFPIPSSLQLLNNLDVHSVKTVKDAKTGLSNVKIDTLHYSPIHVQPLPTAPASLCREWQ